MFSILLPVVVFSIQCFIGTYTVYATLVGTGQTLLLNDLPYYVPAKALTTLPLPYVKSLSFAGGLVPVTVVGFSSVNSSQGTLSSVIDAFGSDDVWNEAFLEGKTKIRAAEVIAPLYTQTGIPAEHVLWSSTSHS